MPESMNGDLTTDEELKWARRLFWFAVVLFGAFLATVIYGIGKLWN